MKLFQLRLFIRRRSKIDSFFDVSRTLQRHTVYALNRKGDKAKDEAEEPFIVCHQRGRETSISIPGNICFFKYFAASKL